MKIRLILITFFTLTSMAHASDHIDGVPSLTLHEQVDLTDLYVFKSDNQKRNTTVILNLYPGVGAKGHFSRKVQYNIILRPALLNSPSTASIETDPSISAVIHCRFTDPGHHHSSNKKSTVLCSAQNSNGTISQVHGDVGDVITNAEETLKLYTGARADAFFITREHFDGVTQRKEFVSKHADNLMETINILSIALEIDMKSLFPNMNHSLYAIAAESLTHEGGELKVLDRVGRPEITNLSLHAFGSAKKLKRKYNQTQAFQNNVAFYQDFKDRLTENINAYDNLDNQKDWDADLLNQLTSLLLEDFLVFRTNENCSTQKNDFLVIEKALLMGQENSSCGGRKLTDDIMNTLYSLYIGGLSGDMSRFNSGTTKPYEDSSRQLSKNFPYLAEPDDSFFNPKKLLLNTLIKKSQE